MFLNELINCCELINIKGRIVFRKFNELMCCNRYVKLEEVGTDPMSEEEGIFVCESKDDVYNETVTETEGFELV
jgi:hypothetical protein